MPSNDAFRQASPVVARRIEDDLGVHNGGGDGRLFVKAFCNFRMSPMPQGACVCV